MIAFLLHVYSRMYCQKVIQKVDRGKAALVWFGSNMCSYWFQTKMDLLAFTLLKLLWDLTFALVERMPLFKRFKAISIFLLFLCEGGDRGGSRGF